MKNTLKSLKKAKTISQIAKEKGVSLLYASTQLKKGMKVESEHSNSKEVQKTIALQHLDENIDYYKKLEKIESSFKSGGRTLAQTPAPKKDRIKGSSINKVGSAKDGKSVKLSKDTLNTLKNKLSEFKKENPNKSNITLNDLKAVYRRGSGAYSTSHRPTISGGAPNTRAAWSIARVNKFLKKASGEKVKKAYVQDDDLLKYKNGGEIDADNPKIKNEIIHKSGKVGGLLVGKRHSEGGIKAINKSSGTPLEMEGGEVVITRNAVSDDTKREFEGEMLTNREILSRINESGGGVSFAKGGQTNEDYDCACDKTMEKGGITKYDDGNFSGYKMTKGGKDWFIIKNRNYENGKVSWSVYVESLDGGNWVDGFNKKSDAIYRIKNIYTKHDTMEEGGNTNSQFYKGYQVNNDGSYTKTSMKHFGVKHHDLPPSEAFKKLYEHKYKKGGQLGTMLIIDKVVPSFKEFKSSVQDANSHTIKTAYKNFLQNTYNIVFEDLPHRIQMALYLGNQKLVDKYING